MKTRIRLNIKLACRHGVFLLPFLVTINCIIWDLVGYDMSKEVCSGTHTAISIEQTRIQEDIEEDIARDTEWADYKRTQRTRRRPIKPS